MINYIPRGLKREYHHYRTNSESDNGGFEPAMVILNQAKPGRSFIILQVALWKYLDPEDNLEALEADMVEFQKKIQGINNVLALTKGIQCSSRAQALDDMATVMLVGPLREALHAIPSVCYNLIKCLRMFDITVNPQSAAQLLLWIQDGLDQLKDMAELPPEKELVGGEVTLFESGKKVGTTDLTVKESDLVVEEEA